MILMLILAWFLLINCSTFGKNRNPEVFLDCTTTILALQVIENEARKLRFWKKLSIRHTHIPNRSGLAEGRSNLSGRPNWDRTRNSLAWIAVVKNGCCCQYPSGEAWRNYNVVILDRLISCDQDRIWLPKMNIKGSVGILERVRPFYLYQLHTVPLNSEIDRSCKPHIWYPEPIRLTWKKKCG